MFCGDTRSSPQTLQASFENSSTNARPISPDAPVTRMERSFIDDFLSEHAGDVAKCRHALNLLGRELLIERSLQPKNQADVSQRVPALDLVQARLRGR